MRHAYQLMSAAALRIKIGMSGAPDTWSVAQLRPFTRVQPISQAVRLAKKAAGIAAKTEDGKVTPAITKEVIQGHTSKMPAARKAKAKALILANTPGEVPRY